MHIVPAIRLITARIRRMTGGYVFTRICLLTEGVPTLVRQRVPTFQLIGGGGYLPSSRPRGRGEQGVPTLDGGGGVIYLPAHGRYLTWTGGVPTLDGGYLPRWGYPPPARTGWRYPPPRPGLDTGPSPPPRKRYQRGAVCLLHSRRRTFLLKWQMISQRKLQLKFKSAVWGDFFILVEH